MLIAARQVQKYASEISESGFRENELYQDAIIRELEIVGEAARHVDLEIVWSDVATEVPALIEYLQRIVPPEESS